MTKYHYAALSFESVLGMLSIPSEDQPDAYIAKDRSSEALAYLFNNGYRWIRTDGDAAIFEKAVESVPAVVREALDQNTDSATYRKL